MITVNSAKALKLRNCKADSICVFTEMKVASFPLFTASNVLFAFTLT